MNEIFLIDSLSDVKSVFGSLKVLEDSEPFDQISIVKFAKIVNNYLKMTEILTHGRFNKI